MKNFLKILSIIIFTILFNSESLFSQQLIRCGTDEYEAFRILQNPNLLSVKHQIELDIREIIQSTDFQTFKTSASAGGWVIEIPLVVHRIGDVVINHPNVNSTDIN